MTALENITIYYNQLPKNDTKRDILSKLLPHIRSISSMTIYDTADLCFTSTASISRLVKALGYKSYSEFQASSATTTTIGFYWYPVAKSRSPLI